MTFPVHRVSKLKGYLTNRQLGEPLALRVILARVLRAPRDQLTLRRDSSKYCSR